MSLYGTDQSNWQPNQITEGDFIICKATEGINYVDPTCDPKYQMNKNADKLLGVYHFARPEYNSAEAEAEFFVNNIRGYIGEAILVLDWESPNKWDVAWAKRWLDKVKELTCIKPLIYMSSSVTFEHDWSSVVAGDYGLWVANYGNNDGTNHGCPAVGYWNVVAMHQYTSNPLDKDEFFGDAKAWRAYAGSKGESKPTPKPTPKPQPKEEYYTVQSGDSLWAISQKYGIGLNQIIALNPQIKNPDLIYPNQKVRVK